MNPKKYLDYILATAHDTQNKHVIDCCIRDTREILNNAKEILTDADLALVRLYGIRSKTGSEAGKRDKTEIEK